MRNFDSLVLEKLYLSKVLSENVDQNLSFYLKKKDFESAQKLVDNGVKMDRKTFIDCISPDKTQCDTSIHIRLEKDGIINKSEFFNGKGLIYGAGRGKASIYFDAESYEPYPPKEFKPTYSGDRFDGNDTINKKYNIILNTFVLNVVDSETRELIVKDIRSLLKKGGRAIIVTRGKM
jgi:hypothetical protein